MLSPSPEWLPLDGYAPGRHRCVTSASSQRCVSSSTSALVDAYEIVVSSDLTSRVLVTRTRTRPSVSVQRCKIIRPAGASAEELTDLLSVVHRHGSVNGAAVGSRRLNSGDGSSPSSRRSRSRKTSYWWTASHTLPSAR